MNVSRRRVIGVYTVIVILALMSVYTGWRIQSAARRGWTGLSYIPESSHRGRGTVRVTNTAGVFQAGSVTFLYPGAPADRAGIEWQDRIVALNGIPTSDQARLRALDATVHVGDVVTYRVLRNRTERDVRVRFQSPVTATFFLISFAVTMIVALTFVLIGTFVFWRRPVDSRAVVFFVMTVIGAVSMMNGAMAQVDLANSRGIAVQQSVGDLSRFLAIAGVGLFFAPLLLHLSLIFPNDRPVMIRHRRIALTWIYGYPVYVCVFLVGAMAFFAALAKASAAQEKTFAKGVGLTLLGVVVGLALIALVRLVPRARRNGSRKAIAESPIATMMLVPALLAVIIAIGGVVMIQTHSMTSVVIAGAAAAGLVFLSFAAYPLATVITLYRSYRDSGVEERRQVKWPVWGTMLAVGGRLILALLGFTFGFLMSTGQLAKLRLTPLLLISPDLASKLLYVLIPLSFAFAILKYRLMNIDVIIRRTVLYSILTFVVFALYAVLVAGVGTALVKFAGLTSQTMLVASTVVIALAAVPIRNRLQRMVDRNLFRERRDYPLALRNIANAIGTSRGVDDLLRHSAEQIQQALQNRLVIIAIRRDRDYVAAAKVGVPDEVLGSVRVPVDVDLPSLPEPFRKLGATLVLPVRTHRGALALLALGTKLSDEEFSAEDIEFLNSAASQVAVGIENLRLRDEEVEFEQARAMQQILLPTRFPQLEGFDITGMWQPARSVGGDYYDTLTLGGGKAAICIGDVAGKGMPAALLMANLQAAVKATASATVQPAVVCERLKEIVGGNLAGGKFISFFYGVLDATARTFTYSNAGHNPPILVRAAGEVERLSRGGPAMCRLFKDVPHEQDVVTLASGDRVVLFTDGASEARRGEEEFGDDRLIELLIAHRHLGARELQERIIEHLRDFTAGDFGDDVTLVVIAAN